MGEFLRSIHPFPSEYLWCKTAEVKLCFQQVPERMRTDLENFHGRWAHGRLFTGWDMLAGRVLVPGPPLPFLPVDLTLGTAQPNLPHQRQEGAGREEARQTLGSAEEQSPPKRKNNSGGIPRWLLTELIAFP